MGLPGRWLGAEGGTRERWLRDPGEKGLPQRGLRGGSAPRATLGLALGFSCSSFLAAASMAAAAPSSSFSAMTVGSSGSTHSVPRGDRNQDRLKPRRASFLTHPTSSHQLPSPRR